MSFLQTNKAVLQEAYVAIRNFYVAELTRDNSPLHRCELYLSTRFFEFPTIQQEVTKIKDTASHDKTAVCQAALAEAELMVYNLKTARKPGRPAKEEVVSHE